MQIVGVRRIKNATLKETKPKAGSRILERFISNDLLKTTDWNVDFDAAKTLGVIPRELT